VKPLDGPATVGEPFRIGFSLASRPGGEPLKDVGIEASYDRTKLRLERPFPRQTFPTLRGRVDGFFVFQALEAGSHDVEFLGSSDINNPGVTLRVRVASTTERWFESGRGQLGAGMLAIGLVLVTGTIALRRRREG
jgi:hypothetical protein